MLQILTAENITSQREVHLAISLKSHQEDNSEWATLGNNFVKNYLKHFYALRLQYMTNPSLILDEGALTI